MRMLGRSRPPRNSTNDGSKCLPRYFSVHIATAVVCTQLGNCWKTATTLGLYVSGMSFWPSFQRCWTTRRALSIPLLRRLRIKTILPVAPATQMMTGKPFRMGSAQKEEHELIPRRPAWP